MRRLLLLTLLSAWVASSAFGAFATAYLGACRLVYNQVAAHYFQTREGGWIGVTDALPTEFVMSEKYGVVRVTEFDPVTGDLKVESPRKRALPWTRYLGTTDQSRGRFARLGTEAARHLVELRAQKHFSHAERFPYFFAMRGLRFILGDGPIGTEKHNLMSQVWASVRSRFPELADRNLNGIIESWRSLFPPEKKGASGEAAAKLESALDAFVAEYERATGVSLVKTGIMAESAALRNSGTVLLRSPFLSTEDVHASTESRNENDYLGGNLSEVPLDVFLHVMAKAWTESSARFGEVGKRDIHFMKYEPQGESQGADSKALLEFKDTGDLTALLPVLEKGAESPRFQAFRKSVEDGALILSVPSSTGRNKAGDALGEWLAGQIPGSTHVPGTMSKTGSGPQKLEKTLLDRLTNAQAMDITLGRDVKGKAVVLVDDMVTSGATLEKVKLELMKRGAKSVHLFSLAHSGKEPELDVTTGLVDLPTLQTERAQPAAAVTDREFIQAMTFPFSWQGKKIKDLDLNEKKAKERFEKIFKKVDLASLSLLPEKQLDLLGPDGRNTEPKTAIKSALSNDDGVLVDFALGLYRAKGQPGLAELIASPLGQAILSGVKTRRESLPFRNRVGADVIRWLSEQ